LPEGHSRQDFLSRETRSTLSKRRACCSLVCFIADDEEVQLLLPQILLVSNPLITQSECQQLQEELLPSRTLFLKRGKTSWVDGEALVEILNLLGKCLEAVKPLAQCLLLLDCSPVHATERVARAAARQKLLLHYVPASMTSVLQPLDVYVFAGFKRLLRRGYEEELLRSPDGFVKNIDILRIVFRVAGTYLYKTSWKYAFRGCGFGDQQKHLGRRVRMYLKYQDSEPLAGNDLPSLADLRSVWHYSRALPLGWLFHLPLHRSQDRDGRDPRQEPPPASYSERLFIPMIAISATGSSSPVHRPTTGPSSSLHSWSLPPSQSAMEESLPPSQPAIEQSLPPAQMLQRTQQIPVGRPLFKRRNSRLQDPEA